MARSIPKVTQYRMDRSQNEDDNLGLAIITHPSVAETIYLALDAADYVLDGNTYKAAPMDFIIATDSEDQYSEGTVEFPNVDRRTIALLTRVFDPARVTIRIYPTGYFDLSADPRTVIPGETPTSFYSVEEWFLTDVSATDRLVRGRISGYSYRAESYPRLRATKDLLPGCFVR